MFFRKSKDVATIRVPNGKKITPKKMIVIAAGIGSHGGSIKAVTKKLGKTTRNTILHIEQCELMYGFKYKIEDDRFWVIEP